MKKFLKIAFFALTTFLFTISCTNSGIFNIVDERQQAEILPSTRVFVQGQLVGSSTKGSGLQWPYVSSDGWSTARFSIRADGTLPGYTNQSSSKYYGRPAGKDGKNRGKVSNSYPYGRYNDRDFDYYKVDKKATDPNNIGLFRYVYDTKGLNTKKAILEAPLVEDILADELEDLQKKVDNNQDVTKSLAEINKINSMLELGTDYLNSHVLWYVVKEVGSKDRWHVNGIISPDEIDEPDDIPDNVEVDIHQQMHQDWSEIKTSVHIRTDASSVKINIPLAFDDIVEQDDFNIRVFNAHFKDVEYGEVTIQITHNNDGITILVSDINPTLIENYKQEFGDGLTVEIHSYCKTDNQDDIWEKVKKSAVISTGKPCTVVGQITTAYDYEAIIPIKVMKP